MYVFSMAGMSCSNAQGEHKRELRSMVPLLCTDRSGSRLDAGAGLEFMAFKENCFA